MKRFLSTACLLIGASVASFAGVITSAAGTQLLGSNASLQTFDDPSAFPLNSFTSLPQFTLSNGAGVTISVSTSPTTSQNSTNTGSQARVSNIAADLNNFGGTLSGSYLNTFVPNPSASNSNSFARTLTFTFTGGVSEFLIDYFGSDSSANFFTVNGGSANALPSNTCQFNVNCNNTGSQIGFVSDGSTPVINSISFTFVGLDSASGWGGDVVLFDNLRVVAGASNGSNGTGTNGEGNGEIPEPSTYALMGAGLLGLAYARRRKQ